MYMSHVCALLQDACWLLVCCGVAQHCTIQLHPSQLQRVQETRHSGHTSAREQSAERECTRLQTIVRRNPAPRPRRRDTTATLHLTAECTALPLRPSETAPLAHWHTLAQLHTHSFVTLDYSSWQWHVAGSCVVCLHTATAHWTRCSTRGRAYTQHAVQQSTRCAVNRLQMTKFVVNWCPLSAVSVVRHIHLRRADWHLQRAGWPVQL